jgi:hypothetical protein
MKSDLRRIWEAIEWEKAKDARDISDDAGVQRGRTCEIVRAAVRAFRDKGLPVVSSSDGFMKSVSPAAIAACARNLYQRAAGTQRRADEMLKRIEEAWPSAAYEELADEMLE